MPRRVGTTRTAPAGRFATACDNGLDHLAHVAHVAPRNVGDLTAVQNTFALGSFAVLSLLAEELAPDDRADLARIAPHTAAAYLTHPATFKPFGEIQRNRVECIGAPSRFLTAL